MHRAGYGSVPIQEQKIALQDYKNYFLTKHKLPPSVSPVYKAISKRLAYKISNKALYLSVKRNFDYFFSKPENLPVRYDEKKTNDEQTVVNAGSAMPNKIHEVSDTDSSSEGFLVPDIPTKEVKEIKQPLLDIADKIKNATIQDISMRDVRVTVEPLLQMALEMASTQQVSNANLNNVASQSNSTTNKRESTNPSLHTTLENTSQNSSNGNLKRVASQHFSNAKLKRVAPNCSNNKLIKNSPQHSTNSTWKKLPHNKSNAKSKDISSQRNSLKNVPSQHESNEETKNVPAQNLPNENKDEFYYFALTVAEQLRQLPLDLALETEEVILSSIRRRRIKVLISQS